MKKFAGHLLLFTLMLLWHSSVYSSAETKFEFSSMFDAVLDAINTHNATSVAEDREFLGAVYRIDADDDTRYSYTQGAGIAGQDRITVRFQIPVCSTVVAFWHTHGADHWSRRYFSVSDITLADDWQVPIYLATPDGQLRVYSPGDRTFSLQEARRRGLGNQRGAAIGHLVRDQGGNPLRVAS